MDNKVCVLLTRFNKTELCPILAEIINMLVVNVMSSSSIPPPKHKGFDGNFDAHCNKYVNKHIALIMVTEIEATTPTLITMRAASFIIIVKLTTSMQRDINNSINHNSNINYTHQY